MTALQRNALAAIKKHGSIRKAARSVGINYVYLYRISTGECQTVSDETAAKLGLEQVQTWRRL